MVQDALQQEGGSMTSGTTSLSPFLTDYMKFWEVLALEYLEMTKGVEDSITWRWTGNREYGTKYAYHF